MRQANIHVTNAAKLVYDVNNTLNIKVYKAGSASVLLLSLMQRQVFAVGFATWALLIMHKTAPDITQLPMTRGATAQKGG